MKFLKIKFADINNYIDSFLDNGNTLLSLEKNPSITDDTKTLFVKQFLDHLLATEIFDLEVLSCVSHVNAWSIDFPGWHGAFNEHTGKKVFIIGSEPHIWYKYLQTVYAFNNEHTAEEYLGEKHPLFRFVAELISAKFGITKEQALRECYITDLFPVSPFRGNGIAVGSTDKIQKLLGKSKRWIDIRFSYAQENLPFEIQSVKPKIIITQGKEVFKEVIKILAIVTPVKISAIEPEKGKKQYIRSVTWNDTLIISVPHIGSQRMRTFWNNNLKQVTEIFSSI